MRKTRSAICLIVMLCIITTIYAPVMAAQNYTAIDENNTAQANKSGWVKKGKYYYYYAPSNGEMVKNQLVKVGKYRYGFDKKGRSIRNRKATISGFTYSFDKKGRAQISVTKVNGSQIFKDTTTGKVIYCVDTLKVTKTDSSTLYGYVPGSSSKDLYQIEKSRVLKTQLLKKLKKGQKIKVYHSGELLEVYPVMYGHIYKILVN